MTNGQDKDLEKLLASGKHLAATYPDIFKEINEPRYSIGDIGLNSRVLNYWEKKGNKETLALADNILEIAKSFLDGAEFNYNKYYIGFKKS